MKIFVYILIFFLVYFAVSYVLSYFWYADIDVKWILISSSLSSALMLVFLLVDRRRKVYDL
ncbi:hypothetical protein HMPREF0765_4091 [Sphingobacterium spiritivorum ATCC 33300]|uniref:Uncharacterized protein n=1 Tax=Sphingobacterium spiritivorum ATCC 33300 TaxID=525372 RepID=C2G3D5_SPHSI|nr:hypothetical protein HMPREF0765_4091 [Sphingobacterium spiritivorum ATCC 33300]